MRLRACVEGGSNRRGLWPRRSCGKANGPAGSPSAPAWAGSGLSSPGSASTRRREQVRNIRPAEPWTPRLWKVRPRAWIKAQSSNRVPGLRARRHFGHQLDGMSYSHCVSACERPGRVHTCDRGPDRSHGWGRVFAGLRAHLRPTLARHDWGSSWCQQRRRRRAQAVAADGWRRGRRQRSSKPFAAALRDHRAAARATPRPLACARA